MKPKFLVPLRKMVSMDHPREFTLSWRNESNLAKNWPGFILYASNSKKHTILCQEKYVP